MRLVFLGGPGAGKGTQAKILNKKLGIPHVSTGDIFRSTIQKGGDDAKLLKSYMDAGKLVPDKVVLKIVASRLQEEDSKNGFILDGFPRTLDQAKGLDEILQQKNLKITGVFYFEINPDVLVDRLVSRRVCENCQAPYNLKSMPPKKDGICDLCGGKLIQRPDDQPDVIRKRFQEYIECTAPLVDYYEKQGLLVRLDASLPTEKVSQIIVELVQEMLPK
ncbi:MAG: adenylate kinase [Planctomycetota bacterium]|nr:MAG: adenylate kinase [Planctomycetota bacterium]